MKSRILTCISALALFAALAIPVRLAAQELGQQEQKKAHTRYKLIVLGTFSGPKSFFSDLNNRGTGVGVADTTPPDPFFPNANPLINNFGPDPFVYHVFQWQDGTLKDMGALPGVNSSAVSWISENGLITGQSINGTIDPLTGWPEENAVLWRDGQVINLGTLGGNESGAGSVNNYGQVVGFSGNVVPDPFSLFGIVTQTRAFLWQNGQMQDLGTLGGPDAVAIFINEGGQAAGLSYTNATPNPGTGLPTTDPFLWDHGRMIDLGTLGGTFGGPGETNPLNKRGQVVGQSNLAGDTETHAFLWDKGTLTDLGTLGGSFGTANAINDAGEVIGQGTTSGDQAFHAFLWRHGVITDLGSVNGYDCSDAFGINSKGQIVGQIYTCGKAGEHAFLWENGHMIDLNVFVPPGSGLTLEDAEKINDRGEIFGNATLPNGDFRAFLLAPCDDDESQAEGCEEANEVRSAAVQNSAAPAAQIPTNANHGNPTPQTLAALRIRFARRYRGFGTWPRN